MQDDALPVRADEFIYRRVHGNHYRADLPTPVQVAAFRPNENDITGLSVFRASFLQPADLISALPMDKRGNYYVVRLALAELWKLGLSVLPDPVPTGPPGHALIPELSWPSYHADKRRLQDVLRELAKLASRDVVQRPSARP